MELLAKVLKDSLSEFSLLKRPTSKKLKVTSSPEDFGQNSSEQPFQYSKALLLMGVADKELHCSMCISQQKLTIRQLVQFLGQVGEIPMSQCSFSPYPPVRVQLQQNTTFRCFLQVHKLWWYWCRKYLTMSI